MPYSGNVPSENGLRGAASERGSVASESQPESPVIQFNLDGYFLQTRARV